MPIPDAALDSSEPVAEVSHWLALKHAWQALELYLEQPVENYFRVLAKRCFERALATDRGIASFAYACPSDQEIWTLTCCELHLKRVSSGRRLLDDMFLRAFQRARSIQPNPDAEIVLACLKKQFELRLRDVVRAWVRERFGSHGQRLATVSLDQQAAAARDQSRLPAAHERIPDPSYCPSALAPTEWRDLQSHAEMLARRWFDDAPPVTRACVLLKAARVSLAHPLVGRTLVGGKTFLFKTEALARARAVALARALDPNLDSHGVRILAAAIYRSMRDLCENWFFAENSLAPLFSLVSAPVDPPEPP